MAEIHIIQKHDIGPPGECVGQLFERIDLDFDWDRRLHLPAGGGHGVGNGVAAPPIGRSPSRRPGDCP